MCNPINSRVISYNDNFNNTRSLRVKEGRLREIIQAAEEEIPRLPDAVVAQFYANINSLSGLCEAKKISSLVPGMLKNFISTQLGQDKLLGIAEKMENPFDREDLLEGALMGHRIHVIEHLDPNKIFGLEESLKHVLPQWISKHPEDLFQAKEGGTTYATRLIYCAFRCKSVVPAVLQALEQKMQAVKNPKALRLHAHEMAKHNDRETASYFESLSEKAQQLHFPFLDRLNYGELSTTLMQLYPGLKEADQEKLLSDFADIVEVEWTSADFPSFLIQLSQSPELFAQAFKELRKNMIKGPLAESAAFIQRAPNYPELNPYFPHFFTFFKEAIKSSLSTERSSIYLRVQDLAHVLQNMHQAEQKFTNPSLRIYFSDERLDIIDGSLTLLLEPRLQKWRSDLLSLFFQFRTAERDKDEMVLKPTTAFATSFWHDLDITYLAQILEPWIRGDTDFSFEWLSAEIRKIDRLTPDKKNFFISLVDRMHIDE